MTDLIEKARAGRTKALQNRVARRIDIEMTAKSHTDVRTSTGRRNQLPMFISARARTAPTAYLH